MNEFWHDTGSGSYRVALLPTGKASEAITPLSNQAVSRHAGTGMPVLFVLTTTTGQGW